MSFQYEEHREISSFWGWLILILLCLAIVAWGILNYLLIPDTPRKWDMGVLRDVPGQSIYSTAEPPPAGAVPKQIAPLPELDQWLRAAPKPIAVTTIGGYSASLLAQAALRLGISIPDDLAILSLSDDETCLFTTPPISAFRSVGAEIGQLALHLIDSRLKGRAFPKGCTEVSPPTIIIDRG